MHPLIIKIVEGFLFFQAKNAKIAMYLLPIAAFMLGIMPQTLSQPSARQVRGIDPLTPLFEEPPAKLVVDPPLPDQLAKGRVVVQYRTQNLRILPIYGTAASKVSPRIGHLHITVDDGPWRWIDASNEPLVINKLPPGPHRILVEMVDPTHQVIMAKAISFTIPVHKEITSNPK